MNHRKKEVADVNLPGIVQTDRDRFKNDILGPMLIKRVSGTEGNLRVQQVTISHLLLLVVSATWIFCPPISCSLVQ